MLDRLEAVAQAQAGSSDGFETLVKVFSPFVLALANYYVGARDAPDVTQEIWLAVHRKLWQLEDGAKFVPWLRTLVFYQCLNFRKARARRQAREVYLSTDGWQGICECVAADSLSPDQLLLRKDLRLLLSELLDGMAGDYGLLLRLFYLQGFSYHEMVELTNLPLSTVKWRLYQGRKLLKASLAKLVEIQNMIL